ncbi:Phage XkdN-like protein [Schinkia azotoformans MEV2011]|uniref:Phage XkdN-like protein n=1 Tax=Schinkia azotoformans MEV2011 TaxID=1348973 RepID=A0A072NU49_SCHAZ|nr:phage portal protein [Schinkia azotoformans]KEF40408.1 Phage XkdN-like protein [Schinkia azotoformans MEV2011]MEC1696181.1 phage portal protein [Schinkia azotoformans]MEC1725316.1 phage portal protein [Schinkia azotoformans]MEC1779427.1 phage portal protein [Schinkia azotoformans]MED4330088.1 phage portal protein [Schinkia azotoformans]
MSKFRAFMKGNVKEAENASLKLDRFDDAIILRPLSAGEADAISDRCYKNKAGRKGKQERVFDAVRYNREICVASMVHPDLNDSELQDSYEVRGADNLYSKMFYLGEATQILEKVTEISGIDLSMDEEIEEAKN